MRWLATYIELPRKWLGWGEGRTKIETFISSGFSSAASSRERRNINCTYLNMRTKNISSIGGNMIYLALTVSVSPLDGVKTKIAVFHLDYVTYEIPWMRRGSNSFATLDLIFHNEESLLFSNMKKSIFRLCNQNANTFWDFRAKSHHYMYVKRQLSDGKGRLSPRKGIWPNWTGAQWSALVLPNTAEMMRLLQ